MTKLLLYDFARSGRNTCWLANSWKTRLLLNCKGIDYDTVFLEYPEVVPTMSSFGLEPNHPGPLIYTLPAVKLPDGTYMIGSAKIALHLDALYPNPPLHVDSELIFQVEELSVNFIMPLVGVLVPSTQRNLVSEASTDYIMKMRAKWFGMPLDQMEREQGGEVAWKNARKGIKEMAKLLNANEGPFFMGETVSYADFHMAAILHWMKMLGEGIYEQFVSHDPAFEALYKAIEPWFARDD